MGTHLSPSQSQLIIHFVPRSESPQAVEQASIENDTLLVSNSTELHKLHNGFFGVQKERQNQDPKERQQLPVPPTQNNINILLGLDIHKLIDICDLPPRVIGKKPFEHLLGIILCTIRRIVDNGTLGAIMIGAFFVFCVPLFLSSFPLLWRLPTLFAFALR